MKSILLICLLFINGIVFGQFQQVRVFPGIEGEELLDKIVDNFKSDSVFFDYGEARDTMFSNVDSVNDSLKCVYSGHTLYLDPNEDPTTFVYMNGSNNGLNTEHTYPRSKGAESGNAKSDMHHLFPTRTKVNADRGNSPFGEINDASTDKWYYKDRIISSIPTENIDLYSESKSLVFEPREDFKGNVARAVMYFYTMYKSKADAADPNFFWDMIPTLCEWHFQDPVDSMEYTRTNLIAQWQEFPNPFILDCSLASRSYCSIINDACELSVPVEDVAKSYDLFRAYFSTAEGVVVIETGVAGIFHLYDMNGRKINVIAAENPGIFRLPILNEPSGMYILQSIYKDRGVNVTESLILNIYR